MHGCVDDGLMEAFVAFPFLLSSTSLDCMAFFVWEKGRGRGREGPRWLSPDGLTPVTAIADCAFAFM
jgi:hypothetical protein